MKKKLFKMASGLAIIAAAVTMSSCNPESLTDLGKNPNAVNDLIPNYLFTSVVQGLVNGTSTSLNQGMQYVAYYKDVPDIGGKQYNFLGGQGFGVYNGKLNQMQQLEAALTGANDGNKKAVLKIIKVWELARLTDALGDIPYSEAMKGTEGNYKPKYDTQQEVYNQMFADLEAGCTALDASKPFYGTADILFNGDIAKWKKFGYTIMLRQAMHLSNKDAATAKTWALKALAGGVMTADADMAVYTKFNATFTNGRAPYGEYTSTQDGDNSQGAKMATTFIDFLKTTKDPRLAVIAVVWKTPVAPSTTYLPDTNAAVQKGMIPGGVFGKPANFDSYSEYSPLWWNRDGAPSIILSPAEAYFLTAEAVVRGWYTGTTAKAAYDLGVAAAMRQWALFPSVTNAGFTFKGTISTAQINSYILNGYPYDATASQAKQIEQIITQKWVSLIGDDFGVWTDWRRTGYPAFKFKNWSGTSGVAGNLAYPGSVTGGEMFRRFTYPDERASNNDNQQAALARQGFPLEVTGNPSDLQLGRVWWDKP